MERKQEVTVAKDGIRTVANIFCGDNTPHWKRAGEAAGWFSARFNNEVNGGLSLDIQEWCEDRHTKRTSSKRVMITLSPEAARAIAEVIAAKIELGK